MSESERDGQREGEDVQRTEVSAGCERGGQRSSVPPTHKHVHGALALSDGIIYQAGDVHRRGRATKESDLIDWSRCYT